MKKKYKEKSIREIIDSLKEQRQKHLREVQEQPPHQKEVPPRKEVASSQKHSLKGQNSHDAPHNNAFSLENIKKEDLSSEDLIYNGLMDSGAFIPQDKKGFVYRAFSLCQVFGHIRQERPLASFQKGKDFLQKKKKTTPKYRPHIVKSGDSPDDLSFEITSSAEYLPYGIINYLLPTLCDLALRYIDTDKTLIIKNTKFLIEKASLKYHFSNIKMVKYQLGLLQKCSFKQSFKNKQEHFKILEDLSFEGHKIILKFDSRFLVLLKDKKNQMAFDYRPFSAFKSKYSLGSFYLWLVGRSFGIKKTTQIPLKYLGEVCGSVYKNLRHYKRRLDTYIIPQVTKALTSLGLEVENALSTRNNKLGTKSYFVLSPGHSFIHEQKISSKDFKRKIYEKINQYQDKVQQFLTQKEKLRLIEEVGLNIESLIRIPETKMKGLLLFS